MERCATCKSELADTSKACPTCGSSAGVSTGTLATVAIEAAAAVASAPAELKAQSRSHASRLFETSIPDEGRFPPGTLVNGRYRIVGLLGRGGMGEVYRATDLTLAQAVALKFLPEAGVSERVLERFHAEVRIARQISHPNICRVYDIGEVDGQPFISMEYVDGEDLADLLQRIGRLPADKALETARKICAGLAAAHDKGVIHRDLKPQNIMLNKRGEPVIMDFGLAAVADQLTGAEARNGTPAYMSPEQLRGDEVTAKSDIYALGLVLYEIFAGRRAYEAKTIGDLLKLQEGAQLTSVTSLAADVDPQVEKVIRRCLMADPALRPATPLAVAAALPGGDPLAAALAAGETPSPELVAASGKTEGMDLRYSVPMLLLVLAVVVGTPFVSARIATVQSLKVSYPPAVAAYQARKMASSFGYTATPVDSLVKFGDVARVKDYWQKHDREGRSWAELLSAEPPYGYFYRESPEAMEAGPTGDVDEGNPAPTVGGMVSMHLTLAGQLREFEAIPPEKVDGAGEWNAGAVFAAAGYDEAEFEEVEPEVMPMVAYDSRRAWQGPAPGLPGVVVRVEAAGLQGRVTAVKVVLPWTKVRREAAKAATGAALIGPLVSIAVGMLALLFGLIFATRNLRLNRADKKGALRLGLWIGLMALISWVGSAHHVATTTEWGLFFNKVGEAAFLGLLMWVLYLALEPSVRARWPQSLVTWNRLLAGRLGDAQLGAHILTGAAIASLLFLFQAGISLVDYQHLGTPPGNDLDACFGALSWIGKTAQTLQNAVQSGFIVFFAIFGFRALWKNDYAAALSTAVMFTLVGNGGIWNDAAGNLLFRRLFLLVIFAVLAWILVRMGVVTTVVALLFLNLPYSINLGPALSSWYTPYGLASMAMLVSLAAYAFWRSIGARTLADDPGA